MSHLNQRQRILKIVPGLNLVFVKILIVLLREQSKLLFQIKKSLNPENVEKSGENSEKIRKPD